MKEHLNKKESWDCRLYGIPGACLLPATPEWLRDDSRKNAAAVVKRIIFGCTTR